MIFLPRSRVAFTQLASDAVGAAPHGDEMPAIRIDIILEPTDWRSSDIMGAKRWLLECDDAGEIAWNIKSARSACLR